MLSRNVSGGGMVSLMLTLSPGCQKTSRRVVRCATYGRAKTVSTLSVPSMPVQAPSLAYVL
jgi:hypothetical protein